MRRMSVVVTRRLRSSPLANLGLGQASRSESHSNTIATDEAGDGHP